MPAHCIDLCVESTDVSEKKAYPLRISVAVIEAMQKWSDDELRSLNAQIEFVLRDALRKSGRLKIEPALPSDDIALKKGASTR